MSTKNNLNDNLKKLKDTVDWFEKREDVDVEEGLKRVKDAVKVIKDSRKRLREIENEFEEVKKELSEE
jgi:exonuclease VII small subunit